MEGATQESQPKTPTPALPAEVQLTPWHDPVVEAVGFDPRSMYVEMCWLPTLGPTTTWLYRRLGSWAEFNPDGVKLDLVDLASSMGLGEGLSRNSGIAKSIGRLIRFEAARWVGQTELQVRTALGPVPERYASNLKGNARRLHEEMQRRSPNQIPGHGGSS